VDLDKPDPGKKSTKGKDPLNLPLKHKLRLNASMHAFLYGISHVRFVGILRRNATVTQWRLLSSTTHRPRRNTIHNKLTSMSGYNAIASQVRFDTHKEYVAGLQALTSDPLASTGANMVIFRGSPHARLMVIGEAPGLVAMRIFRGYLMLVGVGSC